MTLPRSGSKWGASTWTSTLLEFVNIKMADDNHRDLVDDTGNGEPTRRAQEVIYCEICTFPPEVQVHLISANIQYCEFSGSLTKCKAWLESEHPDLYNKLYSAGTSP
jgi:hypothetical protein